MLSDDQRVTSPIPGTSGTTQKNDSWATKILALGIIPAPFGVRLQAWPNGGRKNPEPVAHSQPANADGSPGVSLR